MVRIAASLLLFAPGLAFAQGDDCSVATPIATAGVFPFDNTAFTDSGFIGPGAAPCIGNDFDRDVFWAWTSPTTDDYLIHTCAGTTYDTELSVHLGADCSATCLDSNDQDCGDQSAVLLAAVSGTTYLIQTGGWSGGADTSFGPGSLTIELQPGPPAGDTCAAPIAVAGVGSFPYDRTNADHSGFVGGDPVVCGTAQGNVAPYRDVFLVWTSAGAGDYTFDNCGEGRDTIMNLHVGSDCTALCGLENNAGPNCPRGESEIFVSNVLVGDVYLIQIGEWDDSDVAPTLGALNVTFVPSPPVNDACTNPTLISGITSVPYDSTGATTSNQTSGGGPCVSSSLDEADVFFLWTATSAGCVAFDTCGSSYDTVLTIRSGPGCASSCLAQNDDATVLCPSVSSYAEPGVNFAIGDQVLIQLAGFNGAFGTGTLSVTSVACPPPPPANNDCSTATPITGTGTTAWNNEFATTSGFDGGNPTLCMSPVNSDSSVIGQAHKDLFWSWTVPCDGDFQLDTENSTGNTDTRMSVHFGSDCTAICQDSDDDSGIDPVNSSLLTMSGLFTGQEFLIQIGSWQATSSAGDGLLNIARIGGACPTNVSIANICDPAAPHYLGGSADLSTSTFGGGSPSGLHLECTGGPAGEFGFFLVSGAATTSLAIFNGVLCLDAPQGRYNPQIATNQGLPQLNSVGSFDAFGVLQNIVGTSASGSGFDVPLELPFTPPGQMILPGSTWFFQCWFRDQVSPLPNPGSSANFSNVASVQF